MSRRSPRVAAGAPLTTVIVAYCREPVRQRVHRPGLGWPWWRLGLVSSMCLAVPGASAVTVINVVDLPHRGNLTPAHGGRATTKG